MKSVTTTLGGLRCRVLDSGGEADRPELVVVLCHGFGAPGDDLVGLGPELLRQHPALVGRVRFVFPEAPLELSGMGYYGARAWWMIDVERFARALGEPERLALRREMPEGLARARRLLMALVEECLRGSGLGLDRVVLGGFSQGSMVATDVALRLEEAPAALCVFSGTLVCEDEWRKRAPQRRGLRVLQSHGESDPLLPFENAVALRDLLQDAGLQVQFVPFPGPHTIPLEALEAFGDLLAGLLKAEASVAEPQ